MTEERRHCQVRPTPDSVISDFDIWKRGTLDVNRPLRSWHGGRKEERILAPAGKMQPPKGFMPEGTISRQGAKIFWKAALSCLPKDFLATFES